MALRDLGRLRLTICISPVCGASMKESLICDASGPGLASLLYVCLDARRPRCGAWRRSAVRSEGENMLRCGGHVAGLGDVHAKQTDSVVWLI